MSTSIDKHIDLDLSSLLTPEKTDSISGRSYGEGYAKTKKLLDEIESGNKIVIYIPESKIKAINDSFWKGLFSAIVQKYKTKDKVKSFFEFKTDDYFKTSIDKNLTILESIFNT
jgi:hypothetical protein